MCEKQMPCHISDGPRTPEEAREYWEGAFPDLRLEDEDAGYELRRQDEIDNVVLYTAPAKG